MLANKIDLEPHISEAELIRELNLDYIVDNPWIVVPISALRVINIDQVVRVADQAGQDEPPRRAAARAPGARGRAPALK